MRKTARVLARSPELRAKGGIPVRQVTDWKFEFSNPEGIRLDFTNLSNEYLHQSRSTGATLTFKGTGDGSPTCYERSCYRDLVVGGTRVELQRRYAPLSSFQRTPVLCESCLFDE